MQHKCHFLKQLKIKKKSIQKYIIFKSKSYIAVHSYSNQIIDFFETSQI